MAAAAERRLGKPLTWELSVANVDKPPLDFLAMRQRVELLRGADPQRLIALTYAPTFRDKARLFPEGPTRHISVKSSVGATHSAMSAAMSCACRLL